MSQQTPDDSQQGGEALPGQITTPNPVEIFWEKNKRFISAIITLLFIAIAANYLLQWYQRVQRDKTWSTLAEGIDLREAYSPSEQGSSWMHKQKVLGKFDAYLHKNSVEEMQASIAKLAGTKAEPWGIWALACRHAIDGNVDEATKLVNDLAKKHPDFAPLAKQAFPPIFIEDPEAEDPPKARKKGEKKRKLPEPAAMSLKTVLLNMAKANREFRASHKEFFEAPAPDSTETVLFQTSEGSFKVKFYSKAAPKSVKQFLDNVKAKYYDGMRFHRVVHRPTPDPQAFFDSYRGSRVFLGDPESKKEDKSNWGKYQSEKQQPFEDSGISQFPYMLAWDRESDKKDNDQHVFYITQSDCSRWLDGDYTVFGRVIEGSEVIDKIAEGELQDESSEKAGDGIPSRPVLVQSVTIEKK